MDPNTPRVEAERWLGISEKLLASRDLVGSRSFAIRARESDPTNPISEQILAVVDTLMAAEKRVINSVHHDWYSILQLSPLVRDPDLIASHYRRLVLLLNPEHNHLPYADFAIRVVFDAWSVLSDPTKKWMYDSDLSIFLQRTSAPPDPEPVRVDSSSSATYQFFHQPPPPQQAPPPPPQQQQWIHHLHQQEQPQERQLFHQQHHHQPQPISPPPPPQPPQSQWLPQTQSQLQQLLPEQQQRPSPSQWLPQPQQQQQQRIPHAPPPQRPPQWLPEQQLPSPPRQQQQQQQQQQQPQPKEPQIPPQLQRQQPPPQQKQQRKKTPPPPPAPAPAPAQTTPPHRPLQPPPQPPPMQPPQQLPQQPPQPPPPPKENNVAKEKATDNGNNERNDCNDSANVIDNDKFHDGGEPGERFWTACPYCYYLYEYSKIFQDYTLRCQNCRRAFQAVQIPNPPGAGGESSFCSWGFFPIGFSMNKWKKSMPNANGFGSTWMPFSPMFACPVQEVKKKVWTIVDASDDDDDLDVSSDDSDSSGEWGSTRKKVKRANGRSKRGRPPGRKSNAEREKMANQHPVVGENSQIPRNDVVNNKAVASGSLRKQMGKGVRGRKKLDLNVEFSNEVEDHAPVARDGNGEEVGFFEGLDEFLSTLPILHVVGDDKAKPS